MASGSATVKAILSGDTVALLGAQKDPNKAPPELKLSLSSIQAPKLAMKSAAQQTDDEPWAWECREALRNLIIGKAVEFKVDYSIGDRQMGTLTFQGKNVATHLVSQGLAKVVTGQRASPALAELQEAEKEAISKHVGMHGSNGGKGVPRKIAYSTDDDFDGKAFLGKHKGKKLPCIVEWVRDAGHCRVLLLPGKGIETFTLVGVSFAGLQCEGFKRDQDTREEKAEGPTSYKAKHFLEFRVLNRNLEVRLESTDTFGNIYGTLYHPKGVISKFLVSEGFAKVGGPSLGDTESPGELRDLMKEAQAAKKGRWSSYEPTAGLQGKKEFAARVVEVVSGDCLVVKDLDAGEERRVYFSSTKAPKPDRRDTKGEPFHFEAREFLRKKYVGKKVKVSIDYTREPMGPGGTAPTGMMAQMGTMHFASIFDNQQHNLAAEVIAKGYALYQRHRSDDETSEHLDDLVAAEKAAEEKQLGMHGKEKPPDHRFNDLVGQENSSKAKAMATSIKRLGKVDGVVEYSFNAGRFKVRIDRESLYIPFCLGGLRVPQTARPQVKKPADPFSAEAMAFAREMVMHQDVRVEVHDTDKGGNCLGSMWHKVQLDNGKVADKLFAETLLENGFAQTVDFALASVPYANELLAAEEKAKQGQLGVWSLPQDVVEDPSGVGKARTIPSVEVVHINRIDEFFVQEVGDPALERIQQAVAAASKAPGKIAEFKRGQMVLSEFQKDWYRASILQLSGSFAEVFYVDFGNSDNVKTDTLRPCPSSLSNVAEPPRAIRCSLAGLKTTKDFETDAANCMQHYATGSFKCQIEAVYNGVGQAILTSNAGSSLNEKVVKEGVARVDPRARTAVKAVLEKEQQHARRARLCMWRHGDNYDDDEEDSAYVGRF